jgi:hypothetical protein
MVGRAAESLDGEEEVVGCPLDPAFDEKWRWDAVVAAI